MDDQQMKEFLNRQAEGARAMSEEDINRLEIHRREGMRGMAYMGNPGDTPELQQWLAEKSQPPAANKISWVRRWHINRLKVRIEKERAKIQAITPFVTGVEETSSYYIDKYIEAFTELSGLNERIRQMERGK